MSNTNTVWLFIPCLVDQVYPEMGLAMVDVLEHLGYDVRYNPEQTCCGQPAYNAGHLKEARKVAAHFLDCFADAEQIVCPSGSCTAMVRHFYAQVFEGNERLDEALAVGKRVWEFSEFLKKEGVVDKIKAKRGANVAFHCSCHGLRELGLDAEESISLLADIDGTTVHRTEEPHQCCGFGGLFMVKFPDISDAMTRARFKQLTEGDVDIIVSNDPGCIMTLRRIAAEAKSPVKIFHLAEYLADSLMNV